MRAPKFIKMRGDAQWLRKIPAAGDTFDLSFGEHRQRETTYIVMSASPYGITLRKKGPSDSRYPHLEGFPEPKYTGKNQETK